MICGHVNPERPRIGAVKMSGMGLMGLVCVHVWEMGEGVLDGSRWARSQACLRREPNKSTASPRESAARNHGSFGRTCSSLRSRTAGQGDGFLDCKCTATNAPRKEEKKKKKKERKPN